MDFDGKSKNRVGEEADFDADLLPLEDWADADVLDNLGIGHHLGSAEQAHFPPYLPTAEASVADHTTHAPPFAAPSANRAQFDAVSVVTTADDSDMVRRALRTAACRAHT